MENVFSTISITIPREFAEKVKNYSGSSNQKDIFYSPFTRQVDLWYFAFLYAVKNKLDLKKSSGEDSSITYASILDINQIQTIYLAFIGSENDVSNIANKNEIFRFTQEKANAGIAKVIHLLENCSSGNKPMDEILEYIDSI